MGTPPQIQFASLGMADSLILMVLALVVFGPRRLPQIGRQIGKLMYEFRKASNDFKYQMEEELRSAEEADRRKKDEERMKALATVAVAPQIASSNTTTTTIEATIPPAAATSESPYGTEGQYPSVATDEVKTVDATETVPRIQPPSTGEPVAAVRPGSVAAQAEASPAAETASAPIESVRFVDGRIVPAEVAHAPQAAAELHPDAPFPEPVNHND